MHRTDILVISILLTLRPYETEVIVEPAEVCFQFVV
jgi:hypothetical protein